MTTATKPKFRELPILFSQPMVRAIRDDLKTETWRVADFPSDTESVEWVVDSETMPAGRYTGWVVKCGAPLLLPRKCPYGKAGDRLWVRETWAHSCPHCTDIHCGNIDHIWYRASESKVSADSFAGEARWRPSIHMERWASRIMLEVVEVRVGRIQQITDDSCWHEGVRSDPPKHWYTASNIREKFIKLWNSINAKRGFGWDKNPWVWAVTFKRLT